MFWFIKKDGQYYAGGEGDKISWLEVRTGCPTYKTEKAAQDRIDELGIEGAEPTEY